MTKNKNIFRKLIVFSLFILIAYIVLLLANQRGINTFSVDDSKNQISENVVNVYSSKDNDILSYIFSIFTKESGIVVNYISGDGKDLVDKYILEGRLNKADIFIADNFMDLEYANKKRIFQSFITDTVKDRIPDSYYDLGWHWFSLNKISYIIVYAKNRVKYSDLSGYQDLVDSKWKGRLLISSSDDLKAEIIIAAVIDKIGEEEAAKWVNGIINNSNGNIMGDGLEILSSLASGKGDVAIMRSDDYLSIKSSGEYNDILKEIESFYPNIIIEDVSGVGILRNSNNKLKSIKLIEFLLSDRIQQIYEERYYKFPIISSLNKGSIQNYSSYLDKAEIIAKQYGWK